MPKVLDMTLEIKVDKKELTKLKRRLRSLDSREAQVGVFGGRKHPTNRDMSFADVLYVNEIGNRTKNIPERAPLRKTGFAQKSNKAHYARAASDVIKGRKTPIQALKFVGNLFEEQLVEDIRSPSGFPPPNKRSTVEKKGFNNPLFETGALAREIKTRVK